MEGWKMGSSDVGCAHDKRHLPAFDSWGGAWKELSIRACGDLAHETDEIALSVSLTVGYSLRFAKTRARDLRCALALVASGLGGLLRSVTGGLGGA